MILSTQEIESEVWRMVPGYPNHMVSNMGRVKSMPRKGVIIEKILRTHLSTHGYERINLGKTLSIHRLVCSAFYGHSTLHVNHINGIKTDNRLNNLEYCTQEYNNKHAVHTGLLDNKGENHGRTRFTNNQVIVIKEAINAGHKMKDVAKYFKAKMPTISMINSGKRFKYIV